jgi:hypothetical protein
VQFADEEEEEYTKRAARFFKSVSVIATRHISICRLRNSQVDFSRASGASPEYHARPRLLLPVGAEKKRKALSPKKR